MTKKVTTPPQRVTYEAPMKHLCGTTEKLRVLGAAEVTRWGRVGAAEVTRW